MMDVDTNNANHAKHADTANACSYVESDEDVTVFSDNVYLATPGEGAPAFRMLYVDGYTVTATNYSSDRCTEVSTVRSGHYRH